MADFQENLDALAGENVKVVAASVESRVDAVEFTEDIGVTYPVAFDLDAEELSRKWGVYYNGEKKFLHAAGFLMRPEGDLEMAVYSSGAIGRLKAKNCLNLIRHYKQQRAG